MHTSEVNETACSPLVCKRCKRQRTEPSSPRPLFKHRNSTIAGGRAINYHNKTLSLHASRINTDRHDSRVLTLENRRRPEKCMVPSLPSGPFSRTLNFLLHTNSRDTSERESRCFSIGPVDKLANPTFFSLTRRILSSITFNLVSTGPIASMCKHVGS
jgi:hypothetical protein